MPTMIVFLSTFFASVLLVFPGFELLQRFAIRRGEIPQRSVHNWHGKKFLHWQDFAVVKIGDLFFLSLLNASAGLAWLTILHMSAPSSVAIFSILFGLAVTLIWQIGYIRSCQKGTLDRWDFGTTYPGRLTIAGKAHFGYFWLESVVITFSLTYLIWQPIGNAASIGIWGGLIGYLI